MFSHLQKQMSAALYFIVLFFMYIQCSYYNNYNNWVIALNLTLSHVVTFIASNFLGKYTACMHTSAQTVK